MEYRMPLSIFAKWSRLRQHDDDVWEELVHMHPAGCPGRAVRAVVEHLHWRNPRIKSLEENGINLEPRLAEALLLQVWQHFLARPQYDIASEMLWVVSDLTPMLHHWFYNGDAKQIAHKVQAASPIVMPPPNVLLTEIS
jgi:hypothetical protein